MLKTATVKEGGQIIRKHNSLCITSEGKRIFIACNTAEEMSSWKSKIEKDIGVRRRSPFCHFLFCGISLR